MALVGLDTDVVLVGNRQRTIKTSETFAGLALGNCARGHHVEPMEVVEDQQALFTAGAQHLAHRRRTRAVRREGLLGLAIRDEFEREEDAQSANVADDLVQLGTTKVTAGR